MASLSFERREHWESHIKEQAVQGNAVATKKQPQRQNITAAATKRLKIIKLFFDSNIIQKVKQNKSFLYCVSGQTQHQEPKYTDYIVT